MKTFNLLALALLVAMGSSAKAEEVHPSWEFSGGTGSAFTNSSISDSQSGMAGQSTRSFTINGEAAYFVAPQVEVGVNLTILAFNASASTSSVFTAMVGPTYNFCEDVSNSFYAKAYIGLGEFYNGTLGPNFSKVSYEFAVGKRFEIIPHVTYKPEIAYIGTGSGTLVTDGDVPATHNWAVIPFQFALLF
jgi:hypothetical protein